MAGKHSIRFRLLLALNAAIAGLLLAFLVLDYHREIADRLAEKHVAMDEEAQTLLHAVLRLRPQGPQAVQEYVDAVCGQMHDTRSPGHHITVAFNEFVLQALAHHRASPEMLEAVRAGAESPTHQSGVNGETLVVGSARQDGLTVYVSEYLTNVLHSVRRQVLLRLGQIVLLTLMVGAVVNLVLVRMVAKPLESLAVTVAKIAQGQLGVQAKSFKATELACLAQAINSMSSSLAEADRQRQQQMAKARSIQEHLLPGHVTVPGLTIAHFYQPAAEVAGDYYDVIGLADGTWVICIADVTGHGVAAALSAAMLKTLLLHATEHFTGLEQILRYVNQRFANISLTGDFATMFLVRWDPNAATLEYCGAGHEMALFLSNAKAIRELSSTGLPLGVQDDGEWDSQVLCVDKADRLFLMTDGVAEAFSPDDTIFGRGRLTALLDSSRELSLPEVVRQINQTLAAHRGGNTPSDDATLVAIEFAVQDRPCGELDSSKRESSLGHHVRDGVHQ